MTVMAKKKDDDDADKEESLESVQQFIHEKCRKDSDVDKVKS
jgi:hypothetical protein